jgi:hypothetical protein
MGYQAQNRQQDQGQVYYDADTGQYYTMPARQNTFFNPVLGMMKSKAQRNYINDFNNQSMTAKPTPAFTPIDIAALFPQLSQAATGMQGDSQASAGLLGQGAAQSASSGAGRFM